MNMNDYVGPEDTPGGLGSLIGKPSKPAVTMSPAAEPAKPKALYQLTAEEFRVYYESLSAEKISQITDSFTRHMKKHDPLNGILASDDPLRNASITQIAEKGETELLRVIGRFVVATAPKPHYEPPIALAVRPITSPQANTESAVTDTPAPVAVAAPAMAVAPKIEAIAAPATSPIVLNEPASDTSMTVASAIPAEAVKKHTLDVALTDVETRMMSRLTHMTGMDLGKVLEVIQTSKGKLESGASMDSPDEVGLAKAILSMSELDNQTFLGIVKRADPAPTNTSGDEGPSAGARRATIFETEDQREVAASLGMGQINACVMVSGDEPAIEMDVKPKLEAHDQLLQRLGIPPRPRLWPVMMSWPPEGDLAKLQENDASPDQIKAYVTGLLASQEKMMTRAARIDRYIRDNDPDEILRRGLFKRLADNIPLIGQKHPWEKFDNKNRPDPYYGIRWSSLLNETQTAAVSHMVQSWGHQTALTVDGGHVRVTGEKIIFSHGNSKNERVTDMAIQLGLREGVARGWKTFKMSGTHNFALKAAKLARAANVHAEISYNAGPLGLPPRRTITVMPTPPSDLPDLAPDHKGVGQEEQKQIPQSGDQSIPSEPAKEFAPKRPKYKPKDPEFADTVPDDPNISAFDA